LLATWAEWLVAGRRGLLVGRRRRARV